MKKVFYYSLFYGSIVLATVLLWGILLSMHLSHIYQIDSYETTISHENITIYHDSQMRWTIYHHITNINTPHNQITITGSASQDRSEILLQSATIDRIGAIHRLDVWYDSVLIPSLGQQILTDDLFTHREKEEKKNRHRSTYNHVITIDNMDLYLTTKISCPWYQSLRNAKEISCTMRWHTQLILPIASSTHTSTLQWIISYIKP